MAISPKENECYAYLSTMLLDSILVNSNNKYYTEILVCNKYQRIKYKFQ